ncbi:glycosyltransferase [Rhizosphaericola mali]|uniref:Glycosyltransferase n=1 Tax=Rhizosphaericola mali TaxID=2545455 RepID=A0A5P2FUY7_9BACT|nr:glycosyltransferase [Rhizosphaericola mali]QES87286.1 glycosyltransferase [Rhizosphaericola mali]
MTAVILWILAGLLFLYCILILQYYGWFKKLQPFITDKKVTPQISFSIIIPARDEADNIGKCVLSILKNKYPLHLFEVIVIDDFSSDKTCAVVENIQKQYPNLRLFHMAELIPNAANLNSYKKKAIELAIGKSAHNWIITTDADCQVGEEWLRSFNNYILQEDKVFVAAPVSFIDTGSFLSKFQYLDFLSLQGITAAAVSAGVHSMCNGANLCYQKDAFFHVEGFKGVDHLASGDDMFLMHKILKKYPKSVGYLFAQEAIVETLPMDTVKGFINQRIRWASKADSYQDKSIIAVLALVYLVNVFFIVGFIFSLFEWTTFRFWLGLFIVKIIVEMFFLTPVAKFYKGQRLMKYFPIMELPHLVYTVVAGFLGKFGKYQWKGRTVK